MELTCFFSNCFFFLTNFQSFDRVRLEGDVKGEDSSSSPAFVYRCCGKKCAEDCVLLKNARSFHAHVGTRREIHFHAEEKENDDRGPGKEALLL